MSRLVESLAEKKELLGELMKEYRERYERMLGELRVAVNEVRQRGTQTVSEQPLLTLGVAFVLGLTLGVALARARD